MIKLSSYAAKSHQGPYLQINEDGHEVDLVNNLFMVFDGFGGSSVGDNAVNLVKDTIKKFYTKIGGDPESTLPFYYSHRYLIEGNALINAMEYAHFLLKKENKSKDMNDKGGVSAIIAAQSENIITIASTGNCIGFLYSKGKFEVVSNPDNFELISGDHFEKHFKTAPSTAFGLFDELQIKVNELRISKGDRLIFLTDGVYARVKNEEIRDIIQRDGAHHTERIDELFDLSNNRGNLDNQTALILNF